MHLVGKLRIAASARCPVPGALRETVPRRPLARRLAQRVLLLALCVFAAAALAGDPTQRIAAQVTAILRFDPDYAQIEVDEVVEVQVWIDDAQRLYGLDIKVEFDPAYVRVLDADPYRDGIQIIPGNAPRPDLAVRNEVDNGLGRVWYAVTQIPPTSPLSGSGRVCTIRFRGRANGATWLDFAEAVLADADGDDMPVEAGSGEIVVETEPEPVPIEPTETPAPTATPSLGPQADRERDTPSPTPTATMTPSRTATPGPSPTPTLTSGVIPQPTATTGQPYLQPATATPFPSSTPTALPTALHGDAPTPSPTRAPAELASVEATSWSPEPDGTSDPTAALPSATRAESAVPGEVAVASPSPAQLAAAVPSPASGPTAVAPRATQEPLVPLSVFTCGVVCLVLVTLALGLYLAVGQRRPAS